MQVRKAVGRTRVRMLCSDAVNQARDADWSCNCTYLLLLHQLLAGLAEQQGGNLWLLCHEY